MRFVRFHERAVPISRYADPSIPSGGLTTSIVALTTDVTREGNPVVGYGFSSIGRFAQSGLIRERFAPRLMNATDGELANANGTNLDPLCAWNVMMRGEKAGGHGERCVAVGTLDMAVWDAVAKIERLPLYQYLADRAGVARPSTARVATYASGGYLYPSDDLARLSDEIRALLDNGYTHAKMKIGSAPLTTDIARIESALALMPSANHLSVDAMNAYDPQQSVAAAAVLAPYGLWWFEDICDPLDFETLSTVAASYPGRIAAGEALFSLAEARLLNRYGGLRPERDILQFDPAHCYGLTGYLRIVEELRRCGWNGTAFWPHGGHLFTLHVVSALGLGGCEMNPMSFQPFGGLSDGIRPTDGHAAPPEAPGIGFETKAMLYRLFRELHEERCAVKP